MGPVCAGLDVPTIPLRGLGAIVRGIFAAGAPVRFATFGMLPTFFTFVRTGVDQASLEMVSVDGDVGGDRTKHFYQSDIFHVC